MTNEPFEDRMQWLQENFGPGAYTPVRLLTPRVLKRIYRLPSRPSRLDRLILSSPRLSSVLMPDYHALIDCTGGKYHSQEFVVVDQTCAESKDHVFDMLKEVEAHGGEGLMLRKPGSKYEGRRSNTLLKIKVSSHLSVFLTMGYGMLIYVWLNYG